MKIFKKTIQWTEEFDVNRIFWVRLNPNEHCCVFVEDKTSCLCLFYKDVVNQMKDKNIDLLDEFLIKVDYNEYKTISYIEIIYNISKKEWYI